MYTTIDPIVRLFNNIFKVVE
ncbi:hypothetical protein CBM2625_B150081 [Cupriavidus taiwanensis]|uniref:Uncharacterized protein n=1 Tax=Cupriavidus taiwanensis TaxID=164546 RepID=A0A375E9F8_9BURK|nr:hypothetical protein CBM2613_B140078 [Cupriavidus taiwanensis]SPA08452.1 hypothetical protein CBM2625_B150081 [Cupriavidus taiwanensis]